MNESLNRRSIKNRLFFVSLLVVAGIAIPLWLSSCGGKDPQVRINPQGEEIKRDPPLATGSKLPELFIEKRSGIFGVLTLGMKKHVDFTVQNKGTFPLVIKPDGSSCDCFDVDVLSDEILPGESGIVRVFTEPTETSNFTIYQVYFNTNDPNNPDFTLQMKGSVVDPFEWIPKDRWSFGKIDYLNPDQNDTVRGHVISRLLGSFDLRIKEYSSDNISAKIEPIDEETKKKLKAKSGYTVTVKLEKKVPVGLLIEGVRFVQSIGGHSEETLIKIRGTRYGPFRFIPIGNADFWSPEERWLNLGTFSAKKGKTAKIAMIVKNLKDLEFKLTNIKATPDLVKIRLVKVEKFKSKTRQKFELIFEVPPNIPAQTRLEDNAVKIELETNHPFADLLVFYVSFISK